MSFWTEEQTKTDGSFEANTAFEPIPNNTNCVAVIDKAEWYTDEFSGSYISLQWSVLKPSDYSNRKVFQKIKVNDDDAKRADKAKRMLAAIDANAGGKLVGSDKEPTDVMLTKALVGKQMVIKLLVWEMTGNDGEERKGNWISAVSPETAPVEDDFDEDIGF